MYSVSLWKLIWKIWLDFFGDRAIFCNMTLNCGSQPQLQPQCKDLWGLQDGIMIVIVATLTSFVYNYPQYQGWWCNCNCNSNYNLKPCVIYAWDLCDLGQGILVILHLGVEMGIWRLHNLNQWCTWKFCFLIVYI